MLKNLYFRDKLVASLIIACLIPYIFASFFIRTQVESWLIENNKEEADLLLQQTTKSVDISIIRNMEYLIDMIASDDRLIDSSDKIYSYKDYDPLTSVRDLSDEESLLQKYLEGINDSFPLITLISYGNENGGYIESPEFNPTEPYDPRVRPWYINAMASESIVISEPYTTAISNELVISLDKYVKNGDTKIGVISLTIRLDNLMQDISKLKYGKNGYIMIISQDNIIISSPENPEWNSKSLEELNIPALNNIINNNGTSFEGYILGSDRIFNVYLSPITGWKYISVIGKQEILDQYMPLSNSLTSVFVIIFASLMLMLVIVSNRITNPIRKITETIDDMSKFDFDIYENIDLSKFTRRTDEIGMISHSLQSMQSNYIELKKNMFDLDKDIKKIDLIENSKFEIKLSKDNPFESIAFSVNDLLSKVHEYLNKIRSFNAEISTKNALLISSENALKLQLQEINVQKDYMIKPLSLDLVVMNFLFYMNLVIIPIL